MPYVKTVAQRVKASPERVFDVLADVVRYPVWVPNMIRVERIDSGPLKAGSTWMETVRTRGNEEGVDSTDRRDAVTVDRPRRLVMRVLLEQPNVKESAISEAFELIAEADGTRIDATVTIDYGGRGFWGFFGRLMERLSGPLMAKILAQKLEALNLVMEQA